MVVGGRRDTDAAWLGDALKPCRNIYAVAKNVMWLDNHVADVDADPESYTLIFRLRGCKCRHSGLELQCSPNRFDSAGEHRQKSIAGILDDPTTMFGDRGRYTVREERCQFGVRSLFIMVHQPRIAGYVSRQYRRQPAFNPDWRRLHHDMEPNPSFTLR
jgi:hypothetical protein